MKFGHIELFVKDVKISENFYCNLLGFTVVADQDEFKWINLGDLEILLRQGSVTKTQNYQSAPIGLVFYTDDLNKTATALRNKGLIFKGTDRNENCLTFTDPDGHWFQIVNPNEPHYQNDQENSK